MHIDEVMFWLKKHALILPSLTEKNIFIYIHICTDSIYSKMYTKSALKWHLKICFFLHKNTKLLILYFR